MHAFIILFIIVVFWACLRSIGSSRRTRREYRDHREDRRLAEIERRAALEPEEQQRERKGDLHILLLRLVAIAAIGIGIYGQSPPYIFLGILFLTAASAVHHDEQARRAQRRGEQRREREILMRRALQGSAGAPPTPQAVSPRLSK